MKKMTLPITSVNSSNSSLDDVRRRVLGTFRPVYSVGSLRQNKEINRGDKKQCGLLLRHSCRFPKDVPETSWQHMLQELGYLRMCQKAGGASPRNMSGSLWESFHIVVRTLELVTAAPEEGERFRRRQAVLWVLKSLPSGDISWVHPQVEGNQVETDYSLWPNTWQIWDLLRITCTFPI